MRSDRTLTEIGSSALERLRSCTNLIEKLGVSSKMRLQFPQLTIDTHDVRALDGGFPRYLFGSTQ